MVHDTPPSQDVSTHQIWNTYLKEYRRYGPDTKAGRTDGLTDGRTVQLLYASQSSFGGIKNREDPDQTASEASSEAWSFFRSSLIWACNVCLGLFGGLKFQTLFSFCSQILARIQKRGCQNSKQDISWSSCFFRSSLICVCTVCLSLFGGMANVLKFQTLFSFCSQIKCWLLRLEFKKCLSE